jgi:peptidyl-dipeptidase Dcp
MNGPAAPDSEALLADWTGPAGGVPPWDKVTPTALESAYLRALELKREAIAALASSPEAPTFANTIEALEGAGRELTRLQTLYNTYSQTMAVGEMRAVVQRLAPLAARLDDEISHNQRLFGRIEALHYRRDHLALSDEQRRLLEVTFERALRRGATLDAGSRARLTAINARCAELFAHFMRNLQADEQQVTWIESEDELAGLVEASRQQLKHAAIELGRPNAWAVRNMRAVIWPVLTQSEKRSLRERVWRMWTARGDHAGEHDNKPIVAEVLTLRGEKARLLGYPSFAHYATADRMARTPEAALEMLEKTWTAVLEATRNQLAAYRRIAQEEGAGFDLAPWDRLHYAEKYRRKTLGFDTEALRPYLSVDAVLNALFWSAERLHGLTFHEISDEVPRLDPTVRVYEVRRGAETTGALYLDLFARKGKGHGSYQSQWRSAESFCAPVLPISCIVSNLPRPVSAEPALLSWEYANVLFHEFGHALHILENRAAYPSLGSLQVAWDFIELPSLLNERWLADRELLGRFARHYRTGKPIPSKLLDALEASLKYDRIFSVNLDYLGCAIVDLKLHLLADGRPASAFEVVGLEESILEELDRPAAWDLIMRIPHCFHAMTDQYAAGLYVYLWADVMAADAAEACLSSPGGLYDSATARRWHETILSAGARVPAWEAFRAFRGRDPDPTALLRRFGLMR